MQKTKNTIRFVSPMRHRESLSHASELISQGRQAHLEVVTLRIEHKPSAVPVAVLRALHHETFDANLLRLDQRSDVGHGAAAKSQSRGKGEKKEEKKKNKRNRQRRDAAGSVEDVICPHASLFCRSLERPYRLMLPGDAKVAPGFLRSRGEPVLASSMLMSSCEDFEGALGPSISPPLIFRNCVRFRFFKELSLVFITRPSEQTASQTSSQKRQYEFQTADAADPQDRASFPRDASTSWRCGH